MIVLKFIKTVNDIYKMYIGIVNLLSLFLFHDCSVLRGILLRLYSFYKALLFVQEIKKFVIYGGLSCPSQQKCLISPQWH